MATQVHVVVLPWLAFGHLIPFFQLSHALAKAGIKVSFVSTPRNIQRLPKVPSFLEPLIQFVGFPLPTLDNHLLPEGAEATVDIPFDKIQYLKVAYDLLRHPFKQFISEQLPHWIIFDSIPYWAPEVAAEHQIPTIHFSPLPASSKVFFGHPQSLAGDGLKRMIRSSPASLTSPPEWVDFPSSLAYRPFEAIGVYRGLYEENASGIRDADRVTKTLQACQAVAIRSCPEYEGKYLTLLEKITNRPVIPAGLLLTEKERGRRSFTDKPWIEIFHWLDKQNHKSVVFVGFGSECKLSKEQVHEIAHGLELSGLPFLWALGKPTWAVDDHDALPLGFCDRTSGRGVVQIGWAPQLEILEHPSIGGSLFHSGWGSIIEILQFGHCLVVLPFVIDQPLNARVLVDEGLAIEIERSEDGSFSREGIAQALKLAMTSEEGESLRVQAREAAKVFGDYNLQDVYFGKLVEYLKNGVKNMREI